MKLSVNAGCSRHIADNTESPVGNVMLPGFNAFSIISCVVLNIFCIDIGVVDAAVAVDVDDVVVVSAAGRGGGCGGDDDGG